MSKAFMRGIKVFLSHASADSEEVLRYATLLRDRGFTVWTYETDMEAGRRTINDQLIDHVESCDFLLLFVSESASNSEWVQKELGLAIACASTRREIERDRWRNYNPKAQEAAEARAALPPDLLLVRPDIIPVWVKDAAWRGTGQRSDSFPYIGPNGERGAFDLNVKGHDPHANPSDTDELLLSQLTPKLLFFGRGAGDEEGMDAEAMNATRVFELYETLFPAVERDKKMDILGWVFERDDGSHTKRRFEHKGLFRTIAHDYEYQFDSWYPVLTLHGRAVAFAFLSYHPPSKLIYGNYVAVQQSWRAGQIADVFWRALRDEVAKTFPECRGLLFEVEPCDYAHMESIVARLERQRRSAGRDARLQIAANEETTIRRFLRLAWYDRRQARLLTDARGVPLVSTTPCLDPALPPTQWKHEEEDFWLAWFPNPTHAAPQAPSWTEATTFSAIEVLAHSLAIEYERQAGAYLTYAKQVARRSIARAPGGKAAPSKILETEALQSLFLRWCALDIPMAI